ncbi:hypothetical protein AR457_27440 [Streptomyces agglomeratus]|uniref:Uncharacterized protein n=1 Tax=Streptomyces agglomeratus TaxID=285458 RepID=A0A1E5PDM2_9ACTN|nr:hypothetical protein AS594_27310 [Streptomyces agglomeratus]OEJ38301.1 hypothetical protein BGK70_09215 [Streptomyces agglomeratus]OEJ47314.1 hypothetical protein AR457_27440 [Streptomyces agglomeratus]OEJ50829.1 hypothetical protein BGK72_08700 [Streptomyces agglomeratus]OEJ58192.1 hypothetical protein BGM19_09565 [Streptomyces agglomeratus]
MVRHGLRTLIKSGHAGGPYAARPLAGQSVAVHGPHFHASEIRVGEYLLFDYAVTNTHPPASLT